MPGLTSLQVTQISSACSVSYFSYSTANGWQDTPSFREHLETRARTLQITGAIRAELTTVEDTLAFAAGVPTALEKYNAALTAAQGEEIR